MESYLSTYFRCPEEYMRVTCEASASFQSGYFRFGKDTALFGRLAGNWAARHPSVQSYDAAVDVRIEDGLIRLPFDLSEVVENLHREAYVQEWRRGGLSSLSSPYYFIRPFLPVGLRR